MSDQMIWLFFRLDGRIGRMPYFLAGLLMAVVQAFMMYRLALASDAGGASTFWVFAFWIAVFLSLWCGVVLGVKRVHDIGKHGAWAAFCLLFPFPAYIVLCLWPGNQGPNAFGPRTNAGASG